MSNDLLQQAISAYKEGWRDHARDLLLEFVETVQDNELSWLLLSDLVDDPRDKVTALENALTINPYNERARQQLDKVKSIQVLTPREKFEKALEAKENGQFEEAGKILVELVKGGYASQELWTLMSEVAADPKLEMYALKKMLELNPQDAEIKTRLKALQGLRQKPLQLGQYYENRGELQKAENLYSQVYQSPAAVFEEAQRRLKNVRFRMKEPEFKQVNPQLTLARLTVGPVILFSSLMLLRGGLSVLEIPLVFWGGWVCVALGSFLTVISSEWSMEYLLYLFWKSLGGKKEAPKTLLKRLGILLYLLPFVVLVVDSLIGLNAYLLSL